MADFCRACSIDLFGKDLRELAGLTDPASWAEGRASRAICEGCGFVQVDPEGNCASPDCLKAGQPGHNLPWVGEPGYPGAPAAEPDKVERFSLSPATVPSVADLDALARGLGE